MGCVGNREEGLRPHWSPSHPDLSDCKSNSMANLEMEVRQEQSESLIVAHLAKLSGSSGFDFYGGDLVNSQNPC